MEHSPFWAAAALAEFVRGQASWRRTQAQRFPDDARNAQSADALEQLAMHVEALPDSDRHLSELIELDAFDDASHFKGGEDARRAIARWGFGDATSHMRPRDLLQELVAITRRARRKPAQERTSPVTVSTAATSDPYRSLTNDEVRRELLDDLIGFCLEFDRPYRDLEIEMQCRVDGAFGKGACEHGAGRHRDDDAGSAYVHLADGLGYLEAESRRVISRIAPFLVDTAESIAPWVPKIGIWDSLDGPDRHRLAAQIFSKAGISDRLMTLAERYPNVIRNSEVGLPDEN